jgi:pimeloyl-ACP methyl ester carboxylesterase
MLFAPGIEYYTWQVYRFLFKLMPKTMAKTMFKSLSNYRPIVFTQNELQELRQLTCAMRSHRGFHNDLHQAIDQNILCSIECPTLLLHSEYDNAVDASHPINANAKIKNSTIVFFRNHWGHMLWVGINYEPILDELKKHIEY